MSVCALHGTTLRQGKFGDYCPTKLPDGTWCKYKPQGQTTPAPRPAEELPSAPPWPSSDPILAAAALHFAGEMYRGAGPEMAADALELAKKAYQAMKHP